MCNNKSFKNGAVSFYIVVFLTLLFGVITLSFIRIVLNEAVETTNTDLYNSAYDSALAGIEDAKIALIKYHDCLSQGAVGNSTAGPESGCPYIVYQFEDAVAKGSCDVVQRTLARDKEGVTDESSNPNGQHDVIIQETQSIGDDGNAVEMEQAYTCVKITEENDDYLTALGGTDDTRIIPLRSADFKNTKAIELSWFSAANAANAELEGIDSNYSGEEFEFENDPEVQWLEASSEVSLTQAEIEKLEGIVQTQYLEYKPKDGTLSDELIKEIAEKSKTEFLEIAKKDQDISEEEVQKISEEEIKKLVQDAQTQYLEATKKGGVDKMLGFKPATNKPYTPPVLAVDFFQTDTIGNGDLTPYFSFGELSVNNSNSSGTDHGMLVLYPVSSGSGKNFVSANDVLYQSDKYDNNPITLNCDPTISGTYACTAVIEIPPTFRDTTPATSTSFLKVNLPYGRPTTDISARLCTDINAESCDGNYTKLTGVQAAIDSTGRANDLYRRVEVRVELVDLYYPFPEAAIFLSGNEDTDKNFYVTQKCKKSNWAGDDGDGLDDCKNSGEA